MKTQIISLIALISVSAVAQHENNAPEIREQKMFRDQNGLRFAQAPAPPGVPAPPVAPKAPIAPVPPRASGGMPAREPANVPPPHGGGVGGTRPIPAVAPFDQPATARTLIVGSKLDDTARAHIQEDMQIMSRLLDKAVEQAMEERPDRRMGILVTAIPGMRGQNLFLEDYGPVFVVNAPVPLAGPKTQGIPSEPKDSDWERTKRELYGKRSPGLFEPAKYDPQKVEAMKKALLESLKNAANIRNVGASQTITVIVAAPEHTRTMVSRKVIRKSDDGNPKEDEESEVFERKGGAIQNTLTIRVKKADVDAFSDGKLDLEEFTKTADLTFN